MRPESIHKTAQTVHLETPVSSAPVGDAGPHPVVTPPATGRPGPAEQPNSAAAVEPGPGTAGSTITAGPVLTFPRHDREWVFWIYSLFARGGDDERMEGLVVAGDPWSKSRPRFARNGRAYQPKDDREAEARLRSQLSRRDREMYPGNVMVACRFYRSNLQRVDTDNLLKHVCDSATGILWKDDSQVTLTIGELHLDREFPRTIILVANHASTLLRGVDGMAPCPVCGTPVMQSTRSRTKTCGAACSRKLRGLPDLTTLVTCPQCSQPFRRRTTEQRYCSVTCSSTAAQGRPRPRKNNRSRCTQCGAQLAHNRGGRCRDCWRSHPQGQPEPVQAELLISDELSATSPAAAHTGFGR